MYRQGDILIILIDTFSASAHDQARENGRIILAEGEATGHAHAICETSVRSYVQDDGTLVLDAPEGANVVHEEHDTIVLPPGHYLVLRQREYTPQEILTVAD